MSEQKRTQYPTEAAEMYDKPQEACGVFGIYAPGEPVAELTYLGLQALQHRGQQGAGISVSDGRNIMVSSDSGKVQKVFDGGNHLSGLLDERKRLLATGHTRYGTSGTPEELQLQALQPIYFDRPGFPDHRFTHATNGQVEDLNDIALEYGEAVEGAASDSRVMTAVIGKEYLRHGKLTNALHRVLPRFKGAFSSVFSTPDTLVAARDPHGFRPLHLGRLGVAGWVVASEIAALDIAGADPVREIAPGEILTITGPNETGLRSEQFADAKPALCGFEFVYFSRPDNEMFGESVVEVRERTGQLLAARDKVQADMVIGVPESGLAAADGYSRQRDIPHMRRLIRNNYVDRTFIAPSQDARTSAVRNKLNLIGRAVKDKSVVIIDDSLVRGITQTEVVKMFRDAGAREVHIRISSPPYKWPCFFGMDTSRRDELLASTMSAEAICQRIGADSLDFLTNQEMQKAVGSAAGKICTACTTGVYPLEVSGAVGKASGG